MEQGSKARLVWDRNRYLLIYIAVIVTVTLILVLNEIVWS